jgi:acyl carrier protein
MREQTPSLDRPVGPSPNKGSGTSDEAKGIKDTIRAFILSSITISELDEDDNLFESGLANSLFAVQLMTFLEKTFAIEMGMEDLDIENFKSLNAMTALVLKKSGRSGG